LPIPTPIPRNPSPGCTLVSVKPSLLRNRKGLLPPPAMSQTSQSISSPRKQLQRQIPKDIPVDDDDLDVPEFDPLPKFTGDPTFWSEHIAVWRPPTMFDMDVARPQRMLDHPPSETPISISYSVFAKFVDGLEGTGRL
ncbi:hypothetical protein H0H87_011356, partial [Tephrocybe sp. NHM501043]